MLRDMNMKKTMCKGILFDRIGTSLMRRECQGIRVGMSHLLLLQRRFGTMKVSQYRCRSKKKSKAIRVTGRGGLQGCEMLRIKHFLDNRLTDGGKVVSPYGRKD
jgi:hypothetical protein